MVLRLHHHAFTALALSMCLSILAVVRVCAGTIEFVSDGTWTVSSMNADGSRGATIGGAECYGHPAPGGLPSTACPIWLSGFTSSTLSDLVGGYFTKTIFVPGLPTAGNVRVAVDDFAEVRVNGIVVGITGSISDLGAAGAAQAGLRDFDLTPYLVTGNNEIAFRAQNGPYWFSGAGCNPCGFGNNPCGLFFGGSITYDALTVANRGSWGRLKSIYR